MRGEFFKRAVVFWLASIGCANAGDEAITLLRQVSETYRNLKTYHIEQETESFLSSEFHHSCQKSYTVMAVAGRDKIHFEQREDTSWHILVANGRTVWRATPYDVIRADIIGQEDVVVGGTSFPCTIVRVDYKPPPGAPYALRSSPSMNPCRRVFSPTHRQPTILRSTGWSVHSLVPRGN